MRGNRKTLLKVLVATTLALATLLIMAPSPAAASHATSGFRARCDIDGPFLSESGDVVRAQARIDCEGTRVVGVWVALIESGRGVALDFDINRNEAHATARIGCGHRTRRYQAVAVFAAQDSFGRIAQDVVWSNVRFLCD